MDTFGDIDRVEFPPLHPSVLGDDDPHSHRTARLLLGFRFQPWLFATWPLGLLSSPVHQGPTSRTAMTRGVGIRQLYRLPAPGWTDRARLHVHPCQLGLQKVILSSLNCRFLGCSHTAMRLLISMSDNYPLERRRCVEEAENEREHGLLALQHPMLRKSAPWMMMLTMKRSTMPLNRAHSSTGPNTTSGTHPAPLEHIAHRASIESITWRTASVNTGTNNSIGNQGHGHGIERPPTSSQDSNQAENNGTVGTATLDHVAGRSVVREDTDDSQDDDNQASEPFVRA